MAIAQVTACVLLALFSAKVPAAADYLPAAAVALAGALYLLCMIGKEVRGAFGAIGAFLRRRGAAAAAGGADRGAKGGAPPAPGGARPKDAAGQAALSNTLSDACEAAAALFRLREGGGDAPVRLEMGSRLGGDLLSLLEDRRQRLSERLSQARFQSAAHAAVAHAALGAAAGGGGALCALRAAGRARAPGLAPVASVTAPGPGGVPGAAGVRAASARAAAAGSISGAAPGGAAPPAARGARGAPGARLFAAACPEADLDLADVITALVSGDVRVWLVPYETLNPKGCPPQVRAAWLRVDCLAAR